MVKICFQDNGKIVTRFWESNIMYRLYIDCISTVYRLCIDSISTLYRQHIDSISTLYRQYIDCISTFYRQSIHCLSTVPGDRNIWEYTGTRNSDLCFTPGPPMAIFSSCGHPSAVRQGGAAKGAPPRGCCQGGRRQGGRRQGGAAKGGAENLRQRRDSTGLGTAG